MILLRARFPAGRYHATPWDGHVNEGRVAWPPDPWRLMRAFIATWRRKLDPEGRRRDTMRQLLEALAASLPAYHLPDSASMHSRHYMPVRKGRVENRQLIFDAALCIDPQDPLELHWPADLTPEAQELLADLAENIGYLGRAESWIEMALDEPGDDADINCRPLAAGGEPAEAGAGERVELLVPRLPADYQALRERILAEKIPGVSAKKLRHTLPEDWLDALAMETGDLRALRWSAPPAARRVSYVRERPPSTAPRALHPQHRRPTCVRYCLAGRPLPGVEETLRVGEWARLAAMGRGRLLLGQGRIPWQLSGHETPLGNRHGHAFWLPEDSDGDGLIDHLLVHVPAGLDANAERILRTLAYLKDDQGNRLQLLFEGLGEDHLFTGATPLLARASTWRSVTPYLHPWHLKKISRNLSPPERAARLQQQIHQQLSRECRQRGLPEPTAVRELPVVKVGGRDRKPIHFRRFRSKRGLVQPDRLGRFLELEFRQPISGPLALGFGCHFGLGLFAPVAR